MSKIYKSARGKSMDMDKLKLANENTISVGNMRVNARGDVLGVGNKVMTPRNQVMDQIYAVPDAPYSPNDPKNFAQRQAIIEASNAKQLNDLANNLTVPVTQPTESQPVAQPAARGSLASSIAKPTTVTQEPLQSAKEKAKSNGPTRI